jgi:SAM-dependent methyltransferase
MRAEARIDYDHALNTHGQEGPRRVFSSLVPGLAVSSVLDVGCGTGTWLRAALDVGMSDVVGIDGVDIGPDRLLFPQERFLVRDLTQPIDLGRRFDLAICLEVAEHLDRRYAETLIQTLVTHSDCIVFSAAAPGQPGQHHVNCEPPSAWQRRFNDLGFSCDDEIRWRLWDETLLDPWYRQNVFIARKSPSLASREPRLKTVIHPDMLPIMQRSAAMKDIEGGSMPARWYLNVSAKSLAVKVRRRAFGIGRRPSA